MCSQSSIVSIISAFDKVLVELGTGDGQLLAKILEYGDSPNTCYVGIEIDPKQIQKARDKLRGRNIYLINDSLKTLFHIFQIIM